MLAVNYSLNIIQKFAFIATFFIIIGVRFASKKVKRV